MKMLYFLFGVCAMLLSVLFSCEETESDCGTEKQDQYNAHESLFTNPNDIYWGVTGDIRSYTYNFTCGNICTQQNPKVSFTMGLVNSNFGSSNPISVNAGIYTCLGVQAHHVTMTPDAEQVFYRSELSEIGMQQCFSGQSSATIYPYITVSFNTLGSSHEDSLYLINNIFILKAYIEYNLPK
jgi:hypothetical protein